VESPAVRRKTMQAVKSKDTSPELQVRSLIHASGYRYRLHNRELPGCPDLVFRSLSRVIFVNGCFWHGHGCARGARIPKSHTEYWTAKIARNRARDDATRRTLLAVGWKVLVLWECELRDEVRLKIRLRKFLGAARARKSKRKKKH
jgi:DNA mismatch endonuclease (patch repair protein)